MSVPRSWSALQYALARQDPACQGDDRFLSDPSESLSADLASICSTCPVLAQCRDYARESRIQGGFWGGLWRGPRAETRGLR